MLVDNEELQEDHYGYDLHGTCHVQASNQLTPPTALTASLPKRSSFTRPLSRRDTGTWGHLSNYTGVDHNVILGASTTYSTMLFPLNKENSGLVFNVGQIEHQFSEILSQFMVKNYLYILGLQKIDTTVKRLGKR